MFPVMPRRPRHRTSAPTSRRLQLVICSRPLWMASIARELIMRKIFAVIPLAICSTRCSDFALGTDLESAVGGLVSAAVRSGLPPVNV